MCTLNKPDTVTKIGSYINKLSGRLINAYHFYNTGNDYVDGMLAVKSSLAFEYDIRFEADFKASLKDLSMTADPWGNVLCRAGEGEEIVFADISAQEIERVRNELPLLKHRRTDLYKLEVI